MMEAFKNTTSKGLKDRVVIGMDLNDEFAQISYASIGMEPKTLLIDAEEDSMRIPTVLGRLYGENVWLSGAEAKERAEANEAFLIDHLVTKALSGKRVEVETSDYDPNDLLALFIKKCLGRLTPVAAVEKAALIVISGEDPDERMIEVLTQAIKTLRIRQEKVFFLSHAESAFHYILHQPKELWSHDVCIFDMKERGTDLWSFHQNIRTSPTVMMVEEKHYTDMKPVKFYGKPGESGKKNRLDTEFYNILYANMEDKMVSSVYLLGDGFAGDWTKDSLKYICRGRRAFSGNNLFSKGACYGGMEKLEESGLEKGIVFLGKDKIRANLGMKVMREGRESYMALLDAGRNWYDCVKECDLIMDYVNPINIIVTPIDGKGVREEQIYLPGAAVRPARATRIHFEIRMLSVGRVQVVVRDLGFGEFYASTGMVWESEFRI